MKRTIILLAFCAICKIAAFSQAKYEMNVNKTDGMENVFNVEDIKRVYFRERNDGGGTSGGGGTKTPGEAIDLGLPSGTLWASCNVGATKSEEYGGYYAWGETEEKEKYTWSTYKWCDDTSTKLTKYCSKSEYGIVDNKTVLDMNDDVAHVKWGGEWRMPTIREVWELIDNTTKEWITQNGVIGCKYTSKTNGNSIFLPAAGAYGDGIYGEGDGYYWTQIGNLSSSESSRAVVHHFNSKYLGTANGYNLDLAERDDGYSVRPVCSSRSSANKSPSTNAIMQGLGNTSGQTQYEMVIEKNDGTEIVFNIEDIKPVYFRERNDGGGSQTVAYTTCPDNNHPHWIDLGLPSGTKWACCNEGASSPEEYGDYFTYWWEYMSQLEQIFSFVNKGPTKDQIEELVDNCSFTMTWQNNVFGIKFTGPNGGTIFLPAAGHYWDGKLIGDSKGYYWSSTAYNGYSAYGLYFTGGNSGLFYFHRDAGLPVRPVLKN